MWLTLKHVDDEEEKEKEGYSEKRRVKHLLAVVAVAIVVSRENHIPLGYCSVTITGTLRCLAARNILLDTYTMSLKYWTLPRNFSCKSHKNKTDSDALINPVRPTGIIFTIDGSVEQKGRDRRKAISVKKDTINSWVLTWMRNLNPIRGGCKLEREGERNK